MVLASDYIVVGSKGKTRPSHLVNKVDKKSTESETLKSSLRKRDGKKE